MLARRLLLLACSLAATGCSTGAPTGFSSGESWTFPLVGPLENGLLIVPVYIHETGPYLMAIDPDSRGSVIDDQIVKQLGLRNGPFSSEVDETDTYREVYAADVRTLRVGTLTVEARWIWIMKAGTLEFNGRELRGVLGRDVIADSLVFGFDRDRGVAYLATQKGFTPPVGATAVGYSTMSSPSMKSVSRRMIDARIGALETHAHLDLGGASSQLRQKLWDEAGLASVAARFDLRDEAGTIRHVEVGGVADRVTAGPASAEKVVLAPYDDKRWDEGFIDGTIALDVLRGFNMWANWDEARFYFVPRGDLVATAKERVGRWHSDVLDGCAQLGCAAIRMLVPASTPRAPPDAADASTSPVPKPPPVRPRPVLIVDRDPSARGLDLELVLAALGDDGKLTSLPRLIVNIPSGADNASTQLGADYSGTRIVVIDAGLFPRPCPRDGACIDSLMP